MENAIRDLKYGVGLNHLPSVRFAANGAWLAVQVMAHNLARWTAHQLRTPVDLASSPALAVGGEGQPRFGPTASHFTPSLTVPVCH